MSTERSSPANIGRPREFDLDEVIRRAMNVFWDQGYHDASLPDLLAAMEISKGSFYKAFGDKKAVFLKALDLYSEDAVRNVRKALASNASPKLALRNAFLRYVDLSSGSKGVRGCFAVLAAAELLPSDPEVAHRIRQHFSRLERLFTETVLKGQKIGDFKNTVDAEVMARFIVAHVQGMRILGKIKASQRQMLDHANFVVDALC